MKEIVAIETAMSIQRLHSTLTKEMGLKPRPFRTALCYN